MTARLVARILMQLAAGFAEKDGDGNPQMRWREMHQSGRVAIMLEMRSSPQAGSQRTPAMA